MPLVAPLPVALIPSGGTLVSSATQAGNLPPAVKPVAGPYGATGGLDGLAGLAGQNVHGGFAGPRGQGGPSGFVDPRGDEGSAGGNGVPAYDSAVNRVGDVTEKVRIAAARPTMKINVARRSRLPTILLGSFSVVGALAILWFVLTHDGESAPGAPGRTPGAPVRTAPTEAAAPSKPSSPPLEAAKPPTEAAKPPAEPANSPAEPAKPPAEPTSKSADEAPAKVAEPPAKVADPSAEPPAPAASPTPSPSPPAESADTAKPDPRKKKPASVGLQESHPKAVKKTRGKRASKAEPKEQTWNDDSPFMPVATPKH